MDKQVYMDAKREYEERMLRESRGIFTREDLEREAIEKAMRDFLESGAVKIAEPKDYIAYLDARTAPPTHFARVPLGNFMYVALRDCIIPPITGAGCISVIAPTGVKVTHGGDLTHNEIYSVDMPNLNRSCSVYTDTPPTFANDSTNNGDHN